MIIKPNKKYDHVYIVLRNDTYMDDHDHAIQVVKVLYSRAEADKEVDRLNSIRHLKELQRKNDQTTENYTVFYYWRIGRVHKPIIEIQNSLDQDCEKNNAEKIQIEGAQITAYFHDGMSLEDAKKHVPQKFLKIQPFCWDCMKVLQEFREASRGYWIGKGLYRDSEGNIGGRTTIKDIDDIRKNKGTIYELTCYCLGRELVVEYSRTDIVIRSIYSDRDFPKRLTEYLMSEPCFKKVEVLDEIYPGEPNLFYTDLANRLEKGDFEGGEDRSRYNMYPKDTWKEWPGITLIE